MAGRTVPSPTAQECSEWLFPHGLGACVTWADVPMFRKMPGKRPGQGESLWPGAFSADRSPLPLSNFSSCSAVLCCCLGKLSTAPAAAHLPELSAPGLTSSWVWLPASAFGPSQKHPGTWSPPLGKGSGKDMGTPRNEAGNPDGYGGWNPSSLSLPTRVHLWSHSLSFL